MIKKTGINLMIFILIFVETWKEYDTINEFSEWFRTCFNPADSNRLRSHIVKDIKISETANWPI